MANNRAHQAAALLVRRAKKTFGESIVYRSGANAVAVEALRGSKLLRLSDLVEKADADWIVDAADLAWDDEVQTPGLGHQIEVEENGETVVYEVASPGAPEPVYREFFGLLRIHTSRQGVVDD